MSILVIAVSVVIHILKFINSQLDNATVVSIRISVKLAIANATEKVKTTKMVGEKPI